MAQKTIHQLHLRKMSYLHHYGESDPRTIAAYRDWAEAKKAEYRAEIDRLDATLRGMMAAPA